MIYSHLILTTRRARSKDAKAELIGRRNSFTFLKFQTAKSLRATEPKNWDHHDEIPSKVVASLARSECT